MGVLVVTVWQSIAQVHAAYGRQAATVVGNHRSKVLFSGISDVDTGDLVKRLVGDEQVMTRQVSSELGSFDSGRRSVQESLITTGVVPAHVLRQQQTGSALLIHGTIPPAHLIARSQFHDPVLFERASMPLPALPPKRPAPPTSSPRRRGARPSRLRVITGG
jgi:type IV secretion system protein VirD4